MLAERQSPVRTDNLKAPAPAPIGAADDPFDRLRGLIAHDLDAVNAMIAERMISPVPLIPELAAHLIAGGGKRLRPMLTLACAAMCGYGGKAHVKLATAVEFIHTATLLHDDVVDQSDLRRGRKTANMLWGNQSSILVGDFLFSRAFQLMVEAGSLDVLGVLSNAAAVIAEGEVLQLQTARRIDTTQATYLQVISAKTAALFAAAAQVGAMIAGRNADDANALSDYGMRLGIAFQLIDDLLDYTARETELGKTIGDDFREGKVTLPVLIAVAKSTDETRAFWRRVIEEGQQSPDDLTQAMDLLAKADAFSETLAYAKAEGEAAKAALARFPDNAYRRALIDIVDFCVQRAY
jgi:octaprenyl-diphosphate synthase